MKSYDFRRQYAFNIQPAVFQLYSGGEHVQQYIKNSIETREGLACWDNNFWLQLEKYGEYGMVGKLSFLQWLQHPYSFSKFTKEGFDEQETWPSPSMLPMIHCQAYLFNYSFIFIQCISLWLKKTGVFV